jgi:hypothetical protein
MRKHMEKESAEELLGRYRHESLLVVMRVVLPAEGDPIIGEVHQSVVGDSNTMGVASEVVENVAWATEGRFRIHHPVLAEQRTKERTEC